MLCPLAHTHMCICVHASERPCHQKQSRHHSQSCCAFCVHTHMCICAHTSERPCHQKQSRYHSQSCCAPLHMHMCICAHTGALTCPGALTHTWTYRTHIYTYLQTNSKIECRLTFVMIKYLQIIKLSLDAAWLYLEKAASSIHMVGMTHYTRISRWPVGSSEHPWWHISFEHLVLLARAATWTKQLCFPEALHICPNCGTKRACPQLTSLLICKHTSRQRGENSPPCPSKGLLPIHSAAGLHFWGDPGSFTKGRLNKHHATTWGAART